MTRSDARRNRMAVLDAARRVFAAHGAAAPLELVVREAGVGRGTLYRHFPDRESLIHAVMDERVEELERSIGASNAPGVEALLRAFADYTAESPSLMTAIRSSSAGQAHLLVLGTRIEALIEAVLPVSKKNGEVADETTVDDVLLLAAMLEGGIVNSYTQRRTDPVARSLEIVLASLRRR